MSRTLHVLCCETYRPELEAAAAAERWTDVKVASFEARCGRPPLAWSVLRPLLPEEDGDALVLGGACLAGLEVPPERRGNVRQHRRAQCFELVACEAQISEALARNAYLVTPGWLDRWREHLEALGFTGTSAAALFREFARELVLLDTGVSTRSDAALGELARTLALPCSRVPVGLDPARRLLGRLVAEWRLDVERQDAAARGAQHARERADLAATLDFVGRLVVLPTEAEVMAAIEELLRMLFAPGQLHVVRVEDEAIDGAVPAVVRTQIAGLGGDRDWSWTASGAGFLVRVAHGGETVAVVVVDGVACPEFRSRYLDLALSVARVSGLAIRNARAFRRLTAAEQSLEELEQRVARETRTDDVTGSASRRAFLQEAEHEFARVKRYGGELALMVLDVDPGVPAGDGSGQPASDDALREIARICAGAVRAHDLVGRLGGEALAVLLPETGPLEAAEVAERLRQALARAEIRRSGGPPLRLATSVGVSSLAAGDPDVGAVIDRAERALHEAKAAGRDRVVILAPQAAARELPRPA